jgi:hypothetical protein
MKTVQLKDLLPPEGGVEALLAALDGDVATQHERLLKALEPYKDHLLQKEVDYKYLAYAIEYNLGAATAKKYEEHVSQWKPGMRVRVYDDSGENYLGEGVYTGNVAVYFIVMPDGSLRSCSNAEEEPTPDMIPPGAEVHKSDDNPKIVLDNGRVVYGCQVWWEPIK